MIDQQKQEAIEFLKQEFHPDLEYKLHHEGTFHQHPLRGEIHASLFSFDAGEEKFFVFAGDTMPMIYPKMDLTTEELWAVHLGTEYFIAQGVTEDTDRKTQMFFTYLKMVSTVFQEQLYISKPDSIKILKVYQLKDQKHVVGHASFNDKVYSWIVGDITHFVYKKEFPPNIIWALHLGRLLLS